MFSKKEDNALQPPYETTDQGLSSSWGRQNISWDPAFGSAESSAFLDAPEEDNRASMANHFEDSPKNRRPSIGVRFNSLTQRGGVNSIENFARSWTRAASFMEVIPNQQPFLIRNEDDQQEYEDPFSDTRDTEAAQLSITDLWTHHQTDASQRNHTINAKDLTDAHHLSLPRGSKSLLPQRENLKSMDSLLGADLNSAKKSSLPGSLDTSYGTMQLDLPNSSRANVGELWRQKQESVSRKKSHSDLGEREPVLLKEVKQDGKTVLQVAGQSTYPQTVFNSTNVLIGIGILSLPLGFKYAGWILGMIIMLLSASITAFTAKLLSKCMDVDPSILTFADIAFVSYGEKARMATSFLFTIELMAVCVALIVVFSDTLGLLIPEVGVLEWKILCGLFLIPMGFLPLRLLSFSSVIGIFSCLAIVLIIFIDGIIKPHSPGSLIEPATTYLFPKNWLALPLSFGLLMSPWGGHSVFPNIYRDMRHPNKFMRAVKVSFTFTYLLDLFTAAIGILMFGDATSNEISSNILNMSEYPPTLSMFLSIFIAIIPITKVTLISRPIVSTIEVLAGITTPSVNLEENTKQSSLRRNVAKFIVRVTVIIVFVLVSILFPAFDSLMAFMGSALCYTICVILPLLFYVKLFGSRISLRELVFCRCLIVISSIMAFLGTVFAFIPKRFIGI
ncbi:unnamed protein product [Blumeria hordei]|uniref:Amino acid transporter transmembrane domain-containing protein n=2 Tax=Blumeria hordei TaxID=2867405 RepID=A0A383UV92_BLUHO|nr:neutral amino acid transporter [Blumeria hordei DH14]SZF04251.1 unnamed protein product [Blumeria hordei]